VYTNPMSPAASVSSSRATTRQSSPDLFDEDASDIELPKKRARTETGDTAKKGLSTIEKFDIRYKTDVRTPEQVLGELSLILCPLLLFAALPRLPSTALRRILQGGEFSFAFLFLRQGRTRSTSKALRRILQGNELAFILGLFCTTAPTFTF
jgi:hypothetical protein